MLRIESVIGVCYIEINVCNLYIENELFKILIYINQIIL